MVERATIVRVEQQGDQKHWSFESGRGTRLPSPGRKGPPRDTAARRGAIGRRDRGEGRDRPPHPPPRRPDVTTRPPPLAAGTCHPLERARLLRAAASPERNRAGRARPNGVRWTRSTTSLN